MAARADGELGGRAAQPELVEEDVRQLAVVVLAGVHQHVLAELTQRRTAARP